MIAPSTTTTASVTISRLRMGPVPGGETGPADGAEPGEATERAGASRVADSRRSPVPMC
jgi:hypothetical protein